MILEEINIHSEDVHERYAFRGRLDVLLLLFAVLAFVVEWFAVQTLLSGSIFLGVVIHLVVTGFAFIYAVLRSKAGRDNRFAWFLTLCVGLMGPIGAAGVVFAMAYYLLRVRNVPSFAEWFRMIFPRTEPTLSERIYENIELGRDISAYTYSVESFHDVMRLGNQHQKREALMRITQYFDPTFASALREALEDEDNAIRVQAATSIAKIKDAFFNRTVELMRLHQENPERNEVTFALARHYDNYAFTGLLDKEYEENNRQRALQYYQQYLKSEPNNLETRQDVGRLLMRMGELKQAAEWLEQTLLKGKHAADLIAWYAECLYRLGDYPKLRQLAQQYSDRVAGDEKLPVAVRESVLLWAGKSSATVTEEVSI